MRRFIIFVAIIFVFLSGCIFPYAGSPTLAIEKSSHYDGSVFHNLGEKKLKKSFLDFLKWRLFSDRTEWPEWVENEKYPAPPPIITGGAIRITFINHASMLIQMDGLNIITDPVYSERASPLTFMGPKRVRAPGVPFDDLPKIDVILISHNHYDSYDTATLNKLITRDNPKILFGLGSQYYIDDDKKKENIVEMDWGDKISLADITFTFLPARHWAKRGFLDTNKSLWGAFAIQGSKDIYFAGDTGYADHFKMVRQEFKHFDISLIPIGAYEPRWFMKRAHMNPDDAVIAHKDLNTDKSIGIHFGTFQLTNEGIDDPIKDLIIALEKYKLPADDFITLKHGESFILE